MAKSKSGRKLTYLAVAVALVAVFMYLDTIKHKGYVFDEKVLHGVAQKYALMNITSEERFEKVIAEVKSLYPTHINDQQEWIFNIAGGAMGQMTILHSSITEYLIIFGTPIGTEGFSGRFLADDFFMILEGEQWAFPAGALTREVYRPGDSHLMPRGVAKGYRMPDKCFALEYARGWIPAMFPFGFADGIFSTLDYVALWQTVRVSVGNIVRELAQGKF